MNIKQLKLANAWTRKHYQECINCKSDRFVIGSNIIEFTGYYLENKKFKVASKYVLPVSCTDCGHTSFFCAKIIGLITESKDK